jgi:ubiquinone biosynthesis monooxygenase Coq7
MPLRHYSLTDRILGHIDRGLRTLGTAAQASRANPANKIAQKPLSPEARPTSAALMRVNHSGEVSAQALYHAQAWTAKSPRIRIAMQQAAAEENDHLAWCAERLQELDSHVSYLNPLWYIGSFAIGVCAGLAGDKWSLGFVAETERQVVQHLDRHQEKLPAQDHKSRHILQQMRIDEAHHASMATTAGAAALPFPIKILMRVFSSVMTRTAYWV